MEFLLKEIRRFGWMVGVHNDYKVDGRFMTFWLFTNPRTGRFVKAEAGTDIEALEEIARRLGIAFTPHEVHGS